MLTALFLVWLQMSARPYPCKTNSLETVCNLTQRAADETDGKPLSKLRCTIDAVTHKISPPECADDIPFSKTEKAPPVDVPAVQVGERLSYDCGQGIACIDHYVPIYSCKDKSRILEHDENSPPKYWCRKVQP